MNFLAHSLLGFDDSALIAGQFCGDFVRGRDLSRFPAGVEHGIRLHRHLDRFTDTHPGLQAFRQGMVDTPRRFSGIVVDVLFDHYLAKHWESVSDISLNQHAMNTHRALREYESYFPDSLKRFLAALEEYDILENNQHLASIEHTLFRLSQRSPKFAALALSQAQLKPLSESLHDSFKLFYPELEAAAHHYLVDNSLPGEESRE